METTHPDDRFFLFAELNSALDELRDRAAETCVLLAMIDDDAHAAAQTPFTLFTGNRRLLSSVFGGEVAAVTAA